MVLNSHPLLENIIVGNLIVRADPTFGGGELNVSGDYFESNCDISQSLTEIFSQALRLLMTHTLDSA